MKKGKKKLSVQIAFMLVAFQVIVIAVLSSVIYSNTVNTYLTAKNDIIEYWLDMAKDYILSDPAML